MTSAGVSGTLTAQQALERLLDGTSLSHRFIDPSTIAIDIRVAADAVQVTGEARLESVKYSAPPVETPQTIQIIPTALLDEQGATTLTEALRNVPGITMQAGEGGGASNTSGDMFNMRGFSANNSLFVDGVRDDGLLARDVYNLEQIEVFSGPTGSDVGRANAAGYINLTTKTPQREALRSAAISYGAGEHVRTTFDVNQPLSLAEPGTFFGNASVRRECALAGWRRPRTRLHGAPEQIDCAVARVRALDTDAGNPVRTDHAAGQPGRLRPPRSRVTDRTVDVGLCACRQSRWTRRTTTEARTSTTTGAGRTTCCSVWSTTSSPASACAIRPGTTRRRVRQ